VVGVEGKVVKQRKRSVECCFGEMSVLVGCSRACNDKSRLSRMYVCSGGVPVLKWS
jgi:hypothetical protein